MHWKRTHIIYLFVCVLILGNENEYSRVLTTATNKYFEEKKEKNNKTPAPPSELTIFIKERRTSHLLRYH